MIRDALLGGLSVLAILGVVYFALSKWRARNGLEDREETAEKLKTEADTTRERSHVGFRKRARSLPVTTQVFWFSLFLLGAVLCYGLYSIAKTGTPTEMAYATELETALYSLIVITGGVWLKGRQDAQAGELQVVYEGDDANSAKTFYYEREMVEPVTEETTNGVEEILLLPLFKRNRTFGLFWKSMLVADRADLRDLDHLLPEDRAIMRLPMDESATWDQHEERITVRAKDVRTVRDPSTTIAYEVVPSERKSRAEVRDLQDRVDELDRDLQAERKKNAALSSQNHDLREWIENVEHGNTDNLQDSMDVILPILAATNPQLASALQQSGANGTGTGDVGDLLKHQRSRPAENGADADQTAD